jgi:hypothetical protein
MIISMTMVIINIKSSTSHSISCGFDKHKECPLLLSSDTLHHFY